MWPFRKKQPDYPELKEELLILCREWFEKQIGDLPEDELPAKEEIEEDILRMRDETFDRVISSVPAEKFLETVRVPNDDENKRALEDLVKAYSGHEDTTPIFTKLALSKIGKPRYQSGWSLCAIRLVAETWLEQSVA